MSLAKKIIEMYNKLNETLIIVNKGKKNGQVLFLAGGAASGKGFAQSGFIDVNNYKTFDVDALKDRIIKLAQIKGNNPEIANLDLSKPDDVFKIHKYVKDKGLADKQIDNLLRDLNPRVGLPNLLFDVTFKDTKKFSDMSKRLVDVGYRPDEMHLVWVLAGYEMALQQNLDPNRGRVVPSDILFQTHKGAAQTLSSILKGNIPKNLQGEIYVLLSDKDTTVLRTSKDGSPHVSKSILTGKESVVIKDFFYVKVKDAGSSSINYKKVQDDVYKWVKDRVPREVEHLFR